MAFPYVFEYFFCSATTDNPDLNTCVSYLSQITQGNSDDLDICHKTEKFCFKNLLELLGDNVIVTYYIIFYKTQTHKNIKLKTKDTINLRWFTVRQKYIILLKKIFQFET